MLGASSAEGNAASQRAQIAQDSSGSVATVDRCSLLVGSTPNSHRESGHARTPAACQFLTDAAQQITFVDRVQFLRALSHIQEAGRSRRDLLFDEAD
jgi:hypothetical protein